jgi:Bacterial Ig domain
MQNFKKNSKNNLTKKQTSLLIALIVALSLSSAAILPSFLPLSKAAFTPGTVLIDEQFNTPTDLATGVPSGLGSFTTDFAVGDNVPPDYSGMYKEGRYRVMSAGSLPSDGPHNGWTVPAIDSSGYLLANLQSIEAPGSETALLKTTVNLTAGKTYLFEIEAGSLVPNQIDPNLGLMVNGNIIDYTGKIVTNNVYKMSFTATTTGPQEFKIISVAAGNSGNDVIVNYVKLTEGIDTNKPPVATNDSYTTPVDTSITLTQLINDSDPDGDTLSLSKIAGQAYILGNDNIIGGTIDDSNLPILTTNGKLTITKTGEVTFIPNPGFTGTETIPYTISDGNGGFATANIVIVIGTPNQVPVAVDDNYTTAANTVVTLDPKALDTDPDTADVLTVKSIGGTVLTPGTAQTITVTNGTVDVDAAGVIKFTPTTGFSGTATIPYIIQDGKGGEATANQIIVVSATPNQVPVAVDDNYTTAANTAVTINPKENDTDPDNDPLTPKSIAGTEITPGVAQTITVPEGLIDIDTTGLIKFTPKTGFVGMATIAYIIHDSKGGQAPANIKIDVKANPVVEIIPTPAATPRTGGSANTIIGVISVIATSIMALFVINKSKETKEGKESK